MRMLARRGEEVGVDSGAAADVPDGLEVHLDSDGLDLLDRAQTIVKSPGVPQDAPLVQAARARGIEVTGELELAWRLMPETRFVAVTGTNGKTTTTELLGVMYGAATAGNVGTALSSLVDEPPPLVVCEVSSFQLEDASQFAPDVAVLINLGEDHLDRHGTVEAYHAAKMRIFANLAGDDVAVVPFDLGPRVPNSVTFGGDQADLAHVGERLLWRGEPLIEVGGIRLRGAHNLENAMAAAAAARVNGTPADDVRRALETFAGVPHRLEEVAERDGVLYVNDSKATNVASTLVALRAFPERRVHLLLGGQGKGQDFAPLRAAVDEGDVVPYAFGEDAERLPGERHATLDDALASARAVARADDVVLLSPACASFDQFRDFEARGEHFR